MRSMPAAIGSTRVVRCQARQDLTVVLHQPGVVHAERASNALGEQFVERSSGYRLDNFGKQEEAGVAVDHRLAGRKVEVRVARDDTPGGLARRFRGDCDTAERQRIEKLAQAA